MRGYIYSSIYGYNLNASNGVNEAYRWKNQQMFLSFKFRIGIKRYFFKYFSNVNVDARRTRLTVIKLQYQLIANILRFDERFSYIST